MNKRQKKKQQKKAEYSKLTHNCDNKQQENRKKNRDLSKEKTIKDENLDVQDTVKIHNEARDLGDTVKKHNEDVDVQDTVKPHNEALNLKDTATKLNESSKLQEPVPNNCDDGSRKNGWLGYLFFPFSFLIMEGVMACSTGGHLISHYGIYILLFSVGYGLLLQLVTTLSKKELFNRIIQAVCICIISLLYCVIYFLHCEFQVFYNLTTMLAGALDAIDDFSGDIIGMVLTPGGLLHVLLFFSPSILYLLFGKKIAAARSSNMKMKGIMLAFFVVVYGLNVGMICVNETDHNMYTKEYHYDAAITHFGVVTGLRLDVKNSILNDTQEVTFEMESTTEEVMITTEQKEPDISDEQLTLENNQEEEPVIPVGKNELDIDFAALAQKDGGKYAAIDEYVASLEATSKNEYTGLFEGKNLIFFTAEAFSAEVIDRNLTPTLYRLAHKGIQFTDFYQPSGAGTTGGEYSNIFGMLPTAAGESVKKTATHYNWNTIASRLSEEGYYGKAYHNNDYKYYDRHKTHINLGYSDGYEGVGNGLEDVITSQWPESDLEMIQGTLPTYVNKEPFNIYYMTVSGHSLYSFDKNAMAKKHREEVEDLNYSDTVKAYIACQLEFEAALTYLVDELEKRDMADDTVIVISPDHFPYGLGQNYGSNSYLAELYGQSIDNDFIRDHNRLIIWSGCLEDEEPIVVDTPVTSMDILPTLCNLFGTEFDSRLLPGRDVFSDALPLAFTLGYDWKTDKGTYIASKGKFTPVKEGEEVSEEYIEQIKSIVQNKMTYSRSVLKQDYFRHVFETEDEIEE